MEILDKYTDEELKVFALRYLRIQSSMNKYIKKYRKTEKGKHASRKASYYRYWKVIKGVPNPVPYEVRRAQLGR
tara:strand:+ start:114 stop:335 length:222 start_codon:yes stop_codon:yes gene_type:complete